MTVAREITPDLAISMITNKAHPQADDGDPAMDYILIRMIRDGEVKCRVDHNNNLSFMMTPHQMMAIHNEYWRKINGHSPSANSGQ